MSVIVYDIYRKDVRLQVNREKEVPKSNYFMQGRNEGLDSGSFTVLKY